MRHNFFEKEWGSGSAVGSSSSLSDPFKKIRDDFEKLITEAGEFVKQKKEVATQDRGVNEEEYKTSLSEVVEKMTGTLEELNNIKKQADPIQQTAETKRKALDEQFTHFVSGRGVGLGYLSNQLAQTSARCIELNEFFEKVKQKSEEILKIREMMEDRLAELDGGRPSASTA